MYAIQARREHVRHWQFDGTIVWRARWVLLGAAVAALLGFGYTREAAGSALVGGGRSTAVETLTVGPGDTLWDIASSRYPGADVREKIFEIEQLNGLSGPTILAGQRLRVPAS